MRPDYTYEIHKTLEAPHSRHRERELGHRRALKGEAATDNLVARMMDGLKRLRPAPLHTPLATPKTLVVTDRACRLTDGRMGRIALRESDGKLSEICVPA